MKIQCAVYFIETVFFLKYKIVEICQIDVCNYVLRKTIRLNQYRPKAKFIFCISFECPDALATVRDRSFTSSRYFNHSFRSACFRGPHNLELLNVLMKAFFGDSLLRLKCQINQIGSCIIATKKMLHPTMRYWLGKSWPAYCNGFMVILE